MGQEPLKALGEFRSGRVLGWNAHDSYKRELMFGWNLERACGFYLGTPIKTLSKPIGCSTPKVAVSLIGPHATVMRTSSCSVEAWRRPAACVTVP